MGSWKDGVRRGIVEGGLLRAVVGCDGGLWWWAMVVGGGSGGGFINWFLPGFYLVPTGGFWFSTRVYRAGVWSVVGPLLQTVGLSTEPRFCVEAGADDGEGRGSRGVGFCDTCGGTRWVEAWGVCVGYRREAIGREKTVGKGRILGKRGEKTGGIG